MNKKRLTFLFLSIIMTAWRIGKNAYNAPVVEPIFTLDNYTNSTSIAMESWNVYLPPYKIEQYSNVTAIGELVLFTIPAGYVDDSLLFIWNQFISYGVHYEWDMNMSVLFWQDVRSVKLILTSDSRELKRTGRRDDEHLVISVWFHPRTYISAMQFVINFSTHRQRIVRILHACVEFLH